MKQHRRPPAARACGLLLAAAALCAAAGAAAAQGKVRWGTSEAPFAADSPWNSRPIDPVLGDARIPPSRYPPAILSNGWSTRVFVSRPGDPPVTVRGRAGSEGLWNPDTHGFGDVRVPRWPAGVEPAAESDGHADIVDPVAGVIHSFWQLRREKGEWVAAQYAWSDLRGRGWGDPAHYFQGARATGVPSMAGIIRSHEVDDKAPLYRHALAVSLTHNGLSPSPAYVFPATSADREAAAVNKGAIPQGTLLMLPASFDTASLSDARVRKIAETMKVYGAYVVDRNDGTPFVVYAEIGSGLDLHKRIWNRHAVADLERIREALRPVVGAAGWLDGDGKRITPDKRLNLLSMRGPWKPMEGDQPGRFDSWAQAVSFPATDRRVVQKAELPPALTNVDWAVPRPGRNYCLRSEATGGARLRMVLNAGRDAAIDSGELPNGRGFSFRWPAGQPDVAVYAISGKREPSTVRGILRECDGAGGRTQAEHAAPGK